jgi:hypothetical protein
LDTDNKFIARDILEDSLRDVFELNSDLDLAVVKGCQHSVIVISSNIKQYKQTFPGLEDKRDAFPSWVVDPQCGCGEGWADRILRNGVVIEVPRLAVRGDVLT